MISGLGGPGASTVYWEMGNHHFQGATKWSNNVAELTAMNQAMLEIEAMDEPPDQVWMVYDSTYASNALAITPSHTPTHTPSHAPHTPHTHTWRGTSL